MSPGAASSGLAAGTVLGSSRGKTGRGGGEGSGQPVTGSCQQRLQPALSPQRRHTSFAGFLIRVPQRPSEKPCLLLVLVLLGLETGSVPSLLLDAASRLFFSTLPTKQTSEPPVVRSSYRPPLLASVSHKPPGHHLSVLEDLHAGPPVPFTGFHLSDSSIHADGLWTSVLHLLSSNGLFLPTAQQLVPEGTHWAWQVCPDPSDPQVPALSGHHLLLSISCF